MIVVVVGPTGVGKTKLSVELAKKLNAEIINADSMQVYKNLDIATAKVKEEEKEGIPHHLFDICEVEDVYTVYDYQKDARKKIEELESRGKNIVIVGGTGLYIRALLYDYQFQKEEKTFDFSKMENKDLLEEIKKIDPSCPIHINNRRRLERYLTRLLQGDEIEKQAKPLYDFTMIGLTTPRDNLYKRIDERVHTMVEEGVVEEAKKFYDQKIYSKAIMTGIGYKELYHYFDGEITLEEAIELIQKNSRHYAKRQYTFFQNQFPEIAWFETNYQDFSKTVQEVFHFLEGKQS